MVIPNRLRLTLVASDFTSSNYYVPNIKNDNELHDVCTALGHCHITTRGGGDEDYDYTSGCDSAGVEILVAVL